jgi:hypothetical protein
MADRSPKLGPNREVATCANWHRPHLLARAARCGRACLDSPPRGSRKGVPTLRLSSAYGFEGTSAVKHFKLLASEPGLVCLDDSRRPSRQRSQTVGDIDMFVLGSPQSLTAVNYFIKVSALGFSQRTGERRV